ncbi:MAG TPA: hypothetical protein VIU37_09010, partial [Candidatus Limnocylindrales bacterium]
FTLELTATQAADLSAAALSGDVGVTVEARVPVAPSSLRSHPAVTLGRATLAQPIASDRIVEVNLTATFAEGAPDGCYDLVEVVPSGLAPLDVGWGATDDRGITWPWSVSGQEVRFCAGNDPATGRVAKLRYLARVVNEGWFTWEPAILQLASAPELMAVTPAWTARIGTP